MAKFKGIGENAAKYALGALTEGPTGILRAAVDLQDSRKTHSRKKKLKSTPTTTNINTSPNVTHVAYSSGASNGAHNFSRDPWRNEEDGSV